jgi:LysR family glycine cleavage system transcriptional activator
LTVSLLLRKLPPLNALKYFEVVARKGTFYGAADELCVSVSAVSHQIKQLEEYLNLTLFDRLARKIELTEVGKKYYPILREAFDRIAEGTTAILKPQDSNTITVQLYSTIAIRWLIPRLPNFQNQYPDINVRLHTSYADVDFDQSDVDACIKIGGTQKHDLEYCYLFTSEVFPVCSPAFLEKNPQLKLLENLKNASLLQVYPSKNDWQIWLQHAGINDVDPDYGLQFDSYDHALKTALQGMGVAIGMQPYIESEMDSGLLVELYPLLRTKHPENWYFVYRKEKAHLQKISLFNQWLIDELIATPDFVRLRE